MLKLRCSWRCVVLPRDALFVGSRFNREAARTADIADAVDSDVVDHGLGVDIRDRDVGYVVDRAVVIEPVVAPVPALVAMTGVAEAVVHSAVETDLRRPVARIPLEKSIRPAPVARGPEKPDGRRLHPGAGNPEVAIRTVAPVPRNPDVTGSRDRR